MDVNMNIASGGDIGHDKKPTKVFGSVPDNGISIPRSSTVIKHFYPPQLVRRPMKIVDVNPVI